MTNQRANKTERGQAVVILALLLILLFAFLAVVIDGGNGLTQRRIVQNAADAGAMSGVQYFFNPTGVITETTILEAIHRKVESHGVGDSDGIPGNEVNDNVTVFYIDQDGNRLPGCNPLPCGSISEEVRGFEAVVVHEFSTFIGGIVGQSSLQTNSEAMAVAREELSEERLVHYALFAKADDCNPGTSPTSFDGKGVIIGDVHNNVTIPPVTGNYTVTGAVTFTPIPVPISFLFSTERYQQGNPYMAGLTSHDLSSIGTVDEARLTAEGLYDGINLTDGVYYAGDNEIDLPNIIISGTATVTLVSNNSITLGGTDLNLKPYIDDMLIFSSKIVANPCDPPVIVMNVTSDNEIHGLLYAPFGGIETGGSMTSFIGGVLAKTIRLDGLGEEIKFPPDGLFRERQIYFDLVK